MKFKYIAKQKKGATITDFIEADTKTQARKKLIDMGLSIISLHPEKKQITSVARLNISIGWVRGLDISLFIKNLSVMIKAGLPVSEAMEISSAQAGGKLKKILSQILKSLQEGNNLADSISMFPRYFKDFYVDVIKVGEQAGNLEDNLNYLSSQIEKEIILQRKIKAALIYPIIVLSGTLVLGTILSTFVLPRLARLLNSLNIELPWTTRVILWIANVVQNQGLYVLLGIVVIIIAGYFIMRLKFIKPFSHYLLIKMPLGGRVTKIYNIARINRNLFVLLKSGLTINEALETLINIIDNEVYKRTIQKALQEIEKGKSLNTVLAPYENLFPAMVVRMINVGEKSGRLEEILEYLSNFYEDEVDNVTKNLSSIIEPLLLIAIGVVVGFVGLSIITPIYQITGSISPTR